jgi:hypothetical protein
MERLMVDLGSRGSGGYETALLSNLWSSAGTPSLEHVICSAGIANGVNSNSKTKA